MYALYAFICRQNILSSTIYNQITFGIFYYKNIVLYYLFQLYEPNSTRPYERY